MSLIDSFRTNQIKFFIDYISSLYTSFLGKVSYEPEKKNIMLVDDNVYIQRHYIKEFNDAFGDRVKLFRFYNGIHAFRFFKKNPDRLDLIISNILMPGIDGLDLLERCKKFRPKLPFITNTAYDYRPEFERGADAYIVKAADVMPLFETVEKLLDIKVSERYRLRSEWRNLKQ